MKIIAPIFFILMSLYAKAQSATEKYYSKLVVEKWKQVSLNSDTIQIDTLVLKDHSALKFLTNSYVTVQNAFIGKKCKLLSTGEKGRNGAGASGVDGEDGKNLFLVIHFKELESLLLNSCGGNGGNGGRGQSGLSGTASSGGPTGGSDGQVGGNGGNGGMGGNLTLYYDCAGFVASFDEKHDHNITFSFAGGIGGSGGLGGSGGNGGRAPTSRNPSTASYFGNAGKDGSAGINGLNGLQGGNGKLQVVRLDIPN